jgi:hypothetical protein
MDVTYSIRMTRGAYVVSRDDAERVLHAVEAREPHVLVDADTVGDGLYRNPIRIVTAHVLSVAENVAVVPDEGLVPKARALRAVPVG